MIKAIATPTEIKGSYTVEWTGTEPDWVRFINAIIEWDKYHQNKDIINDNALKLEVRR